jgi:hypothetical protein
LKFQRVNPGPSGAATLKSSITFAHMMQPHEPDLSIRALVQEVLFPTHPFEFPLQQPFVVQRQDASIFFST